MLGRLAIVFPSIALALLADSAGIAEEKKTPVAVSAKAMVRDGEHWIEFTITNTGKTPIRLYWHNLPWTMRDYALKLTPVSEKSTIHLAGFMIADPPFMSVSISAGKSLSGMVRLSERFSNLENVLKTENVDLFWSYQGETVHGVQTTRCGGWVYLEKSK